MKALVVGYGRMGRFHAKVLADLGYEVFTVDPAVVEADYATIAEAKLAQDYDVAAIATPANMLVTSAFQMAGTPMLVEKPFATSLQDAEMLAAYLNGAGAPVCVGFVERFNPKVRWLKQERLNHGRVQRATFTRYSDRPSDSPLDLLSHDVDLARYLGLGSLVAEYDHRHDQPEKVRQIEVEFSDQTVWVDLMDHNLSPLHALWHAFLSGKDYPKPEDAVAVFRTLDLMAAAAEMRA